MSKAFGPVRAVERFELEVEPRELCALLGPSGCGKTTLLRLLAGFERPDSGTISLAGEVIAARGRHVPPERRRVGMVFQDYALFPHYDVAGNVAYALDGRPRGERAARVAELLALVGLDGAGSRYPHELSGGQQQRVALARALAPTPAVILLDEPFSNLDAALRVRVRQEVRAILREAQVTALFVTHDQEEALSLADRVAVMRAGRIEQVGTPEEVYGRPATHWVGRFLGDINVIPGQAAGGRVDSELARFPTDESLAGPADVLIRPESVAVGGLHDSGRREARDGVVVDREFYGHDQLVTVELGSGLRLRARCLGFPVWHAGDRVKVWVEGPVNVLATHAPSDMRD